MAKYGRGSSVPQQPYLKALQGPETRSTKDWVKMIHIETVLINTKLSQVGERNGLKNRDGPAIIHLQIALDKVWTVAEELIYPSQWYRTAYG